MSTAPVAKSPVPVASHGITCSMFAGADVVNVLPEKQFWSAARSGRRRGRRVPDRCDHVVGDLVADRSVRGVCSSPDAGRERDSRPSCCQRSGSS